MTLRIGFDLHEVLQGAGAFDHAAQGVDLARLAQELVGDRRARARRESRSAWPESTMRAMPGYRVLHVAEQGRAVHARHAHVGDDDVERGLRELGERLVSRRDPRHVPLPGAAGAADS